MERAVNHYEGAHEDDGEALLQLWPDAAVQMLSFTLSKDPSVRIRRAAMSLLTSVPSQNQSPQIEAIVQLLLLKCREKDAAVQRQAYNMLTQVPGYILLGCCSIEDWRTVLDTALLVHALEHDDDTKQHLQASGCELLHKWLRLDQVREMSREEGGHEMEAGGTMQAMMQSAASLQALQIPWDNPAMCQAYATALLCLHKCY